MSAGKKMSQTYDDLDPNPNVCVLLVEIEVLFTSFKPIAVTSVEMVRNLFCIL